MYSTDASYVNIVGLPSQGVADLIPDTALLPRAGKCSVGKCKVGKCNAGNCRLGKGNLGKWNVGKDSLSTRSASGDEHAPGRQGLRQ